MVIPKYAEVFIYEKTNNQRCLNPYKSNLITEVLLRI